MEKNQKKNNKTNILFQLEKKIRKKQQNKYFVTVGGKNQKKTTKQIFCFSWKNPAPPAEKPLYYMIEKKEDTQVF